MEQSHNEIQIKQSIGWSLVKGESWSNQRKTSRSRVENIEQTQPTYDGKSRK